MRAPVLFRTFSANVAAVAYFIGFGIPAVPCPAVAQTNAWTKPVSGYWEEPYWSLGVLPGSGQTVELTNSGWKAVAINPSTSQNYPGALTIQQLELAAPTNSFNELLLNFAGTTVPLSVQQTLDMRPNTRLAELYSGLNVGGDLKVGGGEVDQDFGFITVNGQLTLDGAYYLTNGTLQAGSVVVASNSTGILNQYAGSTQAGMLTVGLVTGTPGIAQGSYNLYGGTLLTTNLQVGGGSANSLFRQDDGSNTTTLLQLRGNLAPAQFVLSGGWLETAETDLFGSAHTSVEFDQAGGTHLVNGQLRIQGGVQPGFLIYPATYNLAGGELSVEILNISSYGIYNQSNGTATASQSVRLNGGSGFARLGSVLAGGTLATSNLFSNGIGVDLLQTGGSIVVSNLFSFSGVGPYGLVYATYTLSGGNLITTDLELKANMLIAGGPGRVTNPGLFKFSGSLTLSNAVEHLGQLLLAGDSTLDLDGAASQAFFAASSVEPWSAGAHLYISNWNGSTNGGGADQVCFGNSSAGLNAFQLAQIQFVDAAGFPGTNYAKILASGEVVPTMQPWLLPVRQGTNLVLYWTGNFTLQSAPYVQGPYTSVAGATSPYLVDTRQSPGAFFRLALPASSMLNVGR